MLTPEQAAILRADIENSSDPAVIAARGNGAEIGRDDTTLAVLYNADASPAFTVWRSKVLLNDIYSNGFDWPQVDNVSEPRWRIWRELFDNPERSCNPAKSAVRAGIAEVWTGTAAKLAVQAQVLGHCKRACTRAEKLYATGTGSVGTPGFLVWEGLLSPSDIGQAFQG